MTAARLVYWHGRAFRHFERLEFKQAAITQYVSGLR